MADFFKYAAADRAKALAEGGVECLIDGAMVPCFKPPAELERGEFERELIETQTLYHLAGAMALKVPGQIIEFEGNRYTVVKHAEDMTSASATLILERSLG